MKFKGFILFLSIIFSLSATAQDMATYTGNWEGVIPHSKTFNFTITLKDTLFSVSNQSEILNYTFKESSSDFIKIPFAGNTFFEGIKDENGQEINGFIKSGLLLYHVKLEKNSSGAFVGFWNVLMVDALKSQDFYLSVENGSGDDFQAYPILGDNRFTGTWCDGFQKEKEVISFTDFKTGLQFKGKLGNHKIELGVYLGEHLITTIDLKKSETDWKIGGFANGTNTSTLKLPEMERLIAEDSLPNTHAVLISKKGTLVYENYFDGYNGAIPHDMRSASKSISSAVVGLAKDRALFKSTTQSIFEFLPEKYQVYKDSLKAHINIQSLLTMSSGLDAIDYGLHANPKSSATEDNYQRTPDWIESILKAPMINQPNTKANYGSANPFLLGVAIDSMVAEPVELFMDKNLFQPLGISNYIIQTDLKESPYFGGGMYLTPPDMLKFGDLYLRQGAWDKKQIISKAWVDSSFKNYRALENTVAKNGYGYLWWHHRYTVNGKTIQSVEARGAGGQYIFILPQVKTVVVITSGNFRNGKTQQPELIFEKYILPYL